MENKVYEVMDQQSRVLQTIRNRKEVGESAEKPQFQTPKHSEVTGLGGHSTPEDRRSNVRFVELESKLRLSE